MKNIRPLWIVLLLIAGAVASFALDMPVFRFVDLYVQPYIDAPVVNHVIAGLEEFGQLVPIVVTGAAVWCLDPWHGRKIAMRLLIAAALAAMATEGGKALVGRHRPRWFEGQTWAQSWVDVGLHSRSGRMTSFFSGHTSAVVATATVLSECYPPVRPVAIIVAAGCGASRIAVRQHWFSDVYFGAIVGAAFGWLFVPREVRNRHRRLACQGCSEQPAGSSDRWLAPNDSNPQAGPASEGRT